LSQFQIVTARSYNALTRSLRRPGVRHTSTFVVMLECLGNRDEDIFTFCMRNRVTGERIESIPIGMARIVDCYQVVVRVTLPPGRWRLELESLGEGVVATREIEVSS
jgi:hypothetical protein